MLFSDTVTQMLTLRCSFRFFDRENWHWIMLQLIICNLESQNRHVWLHTISLSVIPWYIRLSFTHFVYQLLISMFDFIMVYVRLTYLQLYIIMVYVRLTYLQLYIFSLMIDGRASEQMAMCVFAVFVTHVLWVICLYFYM